MDSLEHLLRLKLACLGDASRFRIVAVLLRAPSLSVTGIAREVGLSQSCTTRHLQALRKVGVLERARAGKEVRFALRREDPDLLTLLGWMTATAPGSLETPPIAPPRAPANGPQRAGAGRGVAREDRIADTARDRGGAAIGTQPSERRRAGAPATVVTSEVAATGPSEADEPAVAPPPGPLRRYNDLEDFLL